MTYQTPPPLSSYPPVPPPPRRSWWGRNWKWVVPVGCLLPILLCGGLITTIVVMVFGALKSSEPYQQSLARVQESAQVQEMLGSPVEAGFFVGGAIAVENADGDANIVYNVSGPKGDGVVHVVATKTDGAWTFQQLTVQHPQANQTIDLIEQPSASDEMEGIFLPDGGENVEDSP